MEVLTVVGRRVAASVENAQLYERVRRQSITLQRALLPDELPEGMLPFQVPVIAAARAALGQSSFAR